MPIGIPTPPGGRPGDDIGRERLGVDAGLRLEEEAQRAEIREMEQEVEQMRDEVERLEETEEGGPLPESAPRPNELP